MLVNIEVSASLRQYRKRYEGTIKLELPGRKLSREYGFELLDPAPDSVRFLLKQGERIVLKTGNDDAAGQLADELLILAQLAAEPIMNAVRVVDCSYAEQKSRETADAKAGRSYESNVSQSVNLVDPEVTRLLLEALNVRR